MTNSVKNLTFHTIEMAGHFGVGYEGRILEIRQVY